MKRNWYVVAPILSIAALVLSIQPSPAFAQTAAAPATADTKADFANTIAEIVRSRSYTSQYVFLANKQFDPTSPQYSKAVKLYAKAYADYSAWTAYLAASMRNGNRPARDAKYNDYVTQAQTSANAFINYVDSQTVQAKAITTIISSLGQLGIKLWTGVYRQLKAQRDDKANAFEIQTGWQTWQDIVAGKPLPTVGQSKGDSEDKSSKPSDTGKSKQKDNRPPQ